MGRCAGRPRRRGARARARCRAAPRRARAAAPRAQHHRVAAELVDAHLEGHARARGGLLEDQRHIAPGKRPRGQWRGLQLERPVQQRVQLGGAELGTGEEMAGGHRSGECRAAAARDAGDRCTLMCEGLRHGSPAPDRIFEGEQPSAPPCSPADAAAGRRLWILGRRRGQPRRPAARPAAAAILGDPTPKIATPTRRGAERHRPGGLPQHRDRPRKDQGQGSQQDRVDQLRHDRTQRHQRRRAAAFRL